MGANFGVNFKIYGNTIRTNNGNVIEEYIPDENNVFKNFEFGMDVFPNRYFLYNAIRTNNTGTKELGLDVYLFGLNNNDTLYSGTGAYSSPSPMQVRIYIVSIYINDILVRDYIPVIDLQERPCLFDKIEKKCYYNQGTGEFLYGKL